MLARWYDDPDDEHDSDEREEIMRNAEQAYEELKARYRQEGRQVGIAEGRQEQLRNLFERRLQRSLSPSENASFARRFARLGADRLTEVVLDVDAERLAAWLADPNAA